MKIRDFIVEKIEKLYNNLGCKTLIEIGLGKGVLTKKLYNTSDNFFIIEMDKSLAYQWEKEWGTKKGTVIVGDVLDVDVEKLLKEKGLLPQKTLIVGNLPYYITSPIFRKFFEGKKEFAGGVFMIQDEVAQKLKSDADKKSYLWWLINYAYDVKYLKGVSAKCFKPVPRVKSAVVELRLQNAGRRIDFGILKEFLDLYAAYSRKTLGRIEKMLEKKGSQKFSIPEELRKKRLEELGWDEAEQILKIS